MKTKLQIYLDDEMLLNVVHISLEGVPNSLDIIATITLETECGTVYGQKGIVKAFDDNTIYLKSIYLEKKYLKIV